MRPVLFILEMPFEDPDAGPGPWFCSHCILLEGVLAINPHWRDHVDVRHVPFPRPRQPVIDMLGEENQWLPALALGDGKSLTDPVEIAAWLARAYGGAAPHP